ncbi:MAG: hypothetical protein KatS3mg108_0645 [Isosphaeraceae bacterium]|nr:MAG: hypothetical protein KatS3mg108_0645 [Isosphaeraceae bacterium]
MATGHEDLDADLALTGELLPALAGPVVGPDQDAEAIDALSKIRRCAEPGSEPADGQERGSDEGVARGRESIPRPLEAAQLRLFVVPFVRLGPGLIRCHRVPVFIHGSEHPLLARRAAYGLSFGCVPSASLICFQ